MKDRAKNVLKGVVGAGLGIGLTVGAYDRYYKKKFNLKSSNPDEKVIEEYDRENPIVKNTDWVNEDHYQAQMDSKVKEYLSQHLESGELHRDKGTLSYNFYRLDDPRATLIIHHGFNEYKEKYSEFIYYMLQNNYQVMIFDAREHGHSREDPDKIRINTKDFKVLVDDLKAIVDLTREKIGDSQSLILFGHSMGGAVSAALVQEYGKQVEALILNTPMFSINTYRVPYSLAYLLSGFSVKTNRGHNPIPFTEIDTPIEEIEYSEDNILLHSDQRGRYYFNLRKTIFEKPTIGGTLNWLYSAIRMLHVINDPKNIKMIRIPTLLIRAENDQIVDPWGIYQFGSYLPNVEAIVSEDDRHETFHNHDEKLKSYFQKVISFMDDIKK